MRLRCGDLVEAGRPSRLSPIPALLLLLLHLLQIDEGDGGFWRLLRALYKHTPVFGDGQLLIERRGLIAGLDVHGYVKLAVCLSAEDAMCRWNIRIIPAYGGADMAMMSDKIVGGIEAYPAQMRQQHIDPRMRRIRRRAVFVFAASVKIA